MSDFTIQLYEKIGSLANGLAKTGNKMTFSEVNERLGYPRKSARAIAKDVSHAYTYFEEKGDHQTSLNIATRITKKNGKWAWGKKEGL